LGKPDRVAVWALAAQQDVDDIWDYYALNVSEEAAGRLVREIEAAAERVARLPLTGSPRQRLLPGLRCVRAPPYLVFYRIVAGAIEVIRVLHERRDLDVAFEKMRNSNNN
jgi:toxin ParE1/3/4